MRQINTLLTFVVVLGISSCSSSRQSTGSADMYSNGPSRSSGSTSGDYYAATPNDQYIQMKASDPQRWSYFDDYDAYDSYYAASPAFGGYYGMGYPSPCYGFGYGYGFGPSFGLGFGDPFDMWNSYFIWNSWYNPYFYNPYYGGGVLLAGQSGNSVYSNLRPFGVGSYGNGLAHYGTTRSGRNAVYRPGMYSTSAYNRGVGRSAGYRNFNENNGFRNNGYRSFQQPSRSYSPSFNMGGGGFRGGVGGFGGRH